MKRYLLSLALLSVSALHCVGGTAEFPRIVEAGTNTLRFVGVGELRKWMIKGCDIAFYAPQGVSGEDALGDKPRCLEFYYYRTIKADQFATAAWRTLEAGFSGEMLARNRAAIDRLHGLYTDVGEGDRFRLTYVPGLGTQLFLNGKLLGAVEGSEFAMVYFSIWLGGKPLDDKLRAKLLGLAR